MRHLHLNNNGFESGEKRLVYRNPEAGPENFPADKSKEIMGRLRALRKKAEKGPAKRPRQKPVVDSFKRRRKPRDPETKKALEKARKWEGLMPPEEVELMQKAHEALDRHYLNPAFILVLERDSYRKTVKPIMEKAMKYPYALRYSTVKNGIVEITRRKGVNSPLAEDFLIRIEQGKVTKVRENKKTTMLKGKDGATLWMNNKEYNKRTTDWKKQRQARFWKNDPADFFREADDPSYTEAQADKIWRESKIKSWSLVPKTLQDIYMTNNRDFPQYLLKWMELRGLDKTDDYKNLKENFERHGKTYEDLTTDFAQKAHVVFATSPQVPNVYFVATRSQRDKPIAISSDGQFLHQNGEGRWVPSPLYRNAVKNGYYQNNEKAKGQLSDHLKEELDKSIQANKEAKNAVEQINTMRNQVSAIKNKLDDAGTPLEKIKEAAMTMLPDTEAYQKSRENLEKSTAKERDQVIAGTKKLLDYYFKEDPDAGRPLFDAVTNILLKSAPEAISETAPSSRETLLVKFASMEWEDLFMRAIALAKMPGADAELRLGQLDGVNKRDKLMGIIDSWITEENLDEALKIANRRVFINEGKGIFNGKPYPEEVE